MLSLRALVATIALCLISSCNVESTLRISNPKALSSCAASGDNAEAKSATLVTFTDGRGEITVVTSRHTNKVLRGRIDMLGVKTWTKYPLRFDFVMPNCRIHFIQPELANTINITDI
jgi:hypothetical protein